MLPAWLRPPAETSPAMISTMSQMPSLSIRHPQRPSVFQLPHPEGGASCHAMGKYGGLRRDASREEGRQLVVLLVLTEEELAKKAQSESTSAEVEPKDGATRHGLTPSGFAEEWSCIVVERKRRRPIRTSSPGS